jgi:outer membrane immunogenic protein
MFKSVFAATLALAAVPALAQDAPQNFNGPFIGVQGGWQHDRLGIQVGLDRGAATSSGFAYGGQAGYDLRAGENVVIGGEVSLTGRTGRTDLEGLAEARFGRSINATARVGYVLDDKHLIYGRGGYTNARFTGDDGVDTDSENRGGFTVGAGYEQAFARNVSARLEYNYSDYGSEDLSDLVGARTRAKINRHAVTAGLNFRF